jgi:hypothetical protein
MRIFTIILLLSGAVTCGSGCFSIDAVHSDLHNEKREHVVVRNYGWILFNCIPLVCGNATENSFMPWAFFRNDITMDKVQGRFANYASRRGKKAYDLKYTDYDTVLFNLPMLQYPLPIPYLICYRELQLSGNLE